MNNQSALKNNFQRDLNYRLNTFEDIIFKDNLAKKDILKKKDLLKLLKQLIASKSNSEYRYNLYFSNSYRKNLAIKIDEEVKSREIYFKEIESSRIFFSFSDREFIDDICFKNLEYKVLDKNIKIIDDKISINYNGIFAPFGEFHFFPEVLNSRYVFSPIFPCQLEDRTELDCLSKMKKYALYFNNIIANFANDNDIRFVSINAMSMGCLKFVLCGQDLLFKIDAVNKERVLNKKLPIQLKITFIHPPKDINDTSYDFINRKVKSIFKVNLRGLIGYVVAKKLPRGKNIIFKEELNKIILNCVFDTIKDELQLKNKFDRSTFLQIGLCKRNLKEVIAFGFEFFSLINLTEDKKVKVIWEIMQKVDQFTVYALNEDGSIGRVDKKNCFYKIKINYNSTVHDKYKIDSEDYVLYEEVGAAKTTLIKKKSFFLKVKGFLKKNEKVKKQLDKFRKLFLDFKEQQKDKKKIEKFKFKKIFLDFIKEIF